MTPQAKVIFRDGSVGAPRLANCSRRSSLTVRIQLAVRRESLQNHRFSDKQGNPANYSMQQKHTRGGVQWLKKRSEWA